ncbi:MAG: lysostaphin resistance A-like protein [Paracoccaceae bacterium]
MLPTRTPAFERFIAPARERPELYRLIGGALLAVAVWPLSILVVVGGGYAVLVLTSPEWAEEFFRAITDEGTPVSTVFFFSTFIGLIVGIFVTLRLVHRRRLSSLIGPSRRILWRHYLCGLGVVAALAALTGGLSALSQPPKPHLEFRTWLSWLPAAAILLAVQTATEELFFRGYLMQQLAARFRSRWLWWVLPSLLFGAMHYNPSTFGSNAWLVVASAAILGLILADVATRTGNLSASMGMHFANNFTAVALVGLPGQLSGLSLYHSTIDMTDAIAVRNGILMQMAVILICYLVYLIFAARRLPSDNGNASAAGVLV